MTEITIRYAQTDIDVVLIHKFLCVVAGPTLPGPIDPKNSIHEIWRLASQDVVLMAMRGDLLVGTLGLIQARHWWNEKVRFVANRFFFALPGLGAGRLLLKEAIGIAEGSGLELQIYDEANGRLKVFNKSKNRRRSVLAAQEVQDVLRLNSNHPDPELHPAGVADERGAE